MWYCWKATVNWNTNKLENILEKKELAKIGKNENENVQLFI